MNCKDKTWREFMKDNHKVLVMIYNTNCPICKQARKPFADCAKQIELDKKLVKLAVINGDKYENDIYRMWTYNLGVPSLFWFVEGEKQFEYKGQRAVPDILHFIENPKKPKEKKRFALWETEESASDVEHLTDSNFDHFASDQEEMLVFFYSLTSKACFKLRKAYEKAARRLASVKASVTMAAINVEKALILKNRYKVEDVPFIAYFRNNRLIYEYHGKRNSKSFVKFMKKPKFIEKPKDEWKNSEVTILSKSTFYQFIKNNQHLLVMFFAKWCGHCQQLKPTFIAVGDILKERKMLSKLAALDVADAEKITDKYQVKGYPTLIYFKDGKVVENYKDKRDTNSLVDFLQRKENNEEVDEETDEILDTKPDTVASLSPDNFEDFLEATPEAFVMFYAPWCGACKASKEAFFETAAEIAEELPDVKLAVFDAVKHRDALKKFKIKGYPTFWYFKDSEMKFQYFGARSKHDFANYLSEPSYQEPPSVESESLKWEDEENSKITKLQTETFNQFMKTNKHVLVFFYIKLCKICFSDIKPELERAAQLSHDEKLKVQIAAVNSDENRKLTDQFNINSFPTFLYFKNGKKKFEYKAKWTSDHLMKFLKKPSKKLSQRVKPTSWQDLDPTLSGSVIHLSNSSFNQFLNDHHHVIIMFHSLYSKTSRQACDYYRDASLRLRHLQPEVALGAVDCYRQPEQGVLCYKFSIRKHPTFKYFVNGKFSSDLELSSADEVVSVVEENLRKYSKEEL